MNSKNYILVLLLSLSTSCKSQSLLPFSDISEIENGKSILSAYTCDDLIEKSKDSNFALKNLAGLRAAARCKDFTFDQTQLSDFERKLYANEMGTLDAAKIEAKLNSEVSDKELLKSITNETVASNKFKMYKQLRLKQKRLKNRQQHVNTSEKMYKWALSHYKKNKKDSEATVILYEAAQLAARTYWTEDKAGKAEKILDESIKILSPKNSVAELTFLKGRIFEEAKKTTEAVTQYDLTLEDIKKNKPNGLTFNTDRILWLKSWILYKEKKYVESEKSFATLANSTTDLSERSRALFYQARSLKYTGEKEAAALAKLILESIIKNDFFGYYGLVSYRELSLKLPALSNVKSFNLFKYDLQLSFLSPHEKDIFTDLVKYREYNLCQTAVGLLAKSKENDISLSLYLAQNNQSYLPLFRAFAKLDNNEKLDVFINYPDEIFPQPYRDRVSAMSTRTKVPSSLIYSIMKQESAFNEKARSGADAMGLMQVIPRLAQHLSQKFEVPYRNPKDLYDPEINIQLGSFELMEQVRKQNGQLTYVAAAYNAGPGALSNWLKNRKRDDILEFIEEIPYDETRTYVKLIARNKLFYERISNRDREHDFPGGFLN
jgi:soluble lytic murein transglycosylase